MPGKRPDSQSEAGQAVTEHAIRAGVERRVKFELANADSFSFPAAAFDLVWTMESSEHFADKSRYFTQVARTLRPGGQILLAAWTGSMDLPRVREVGRVFLCPELWTAERYVSAIESAGMRVRHHETFTARILSTWEICQQRARAASLAVKLLPRAARSPWKASTSSWMLTTPAI